ncbi:hypothetical protein OSB04_020898 [Centaurea solstitialis]|uniref:Uncharacterized protein n=1 Tax=Centaurea solstitialis TaxID=347529 RepID=A0AA38ST61_9ASTR|nr:hypothetical protein OSB04_020898 [Centaurea solstitialis]
MVSEEGCRVRKKAEELGGVVRRSVEDGGVMRKEMDSFVAQLLDHRMWQQGQAYAS